MFACPRECGDIVLRARLIGAPVKAASRCLPLGMNVESDRDRLRELINNLIDNAVKYTPNGGKVTVRWRSDGEMASIEVEDTGIGISRDDQSRVFERFYRVDKARSRELGGTGLGLSIVKHLAQALGGSVEVQSEPGRGSVFSVHLPLA